jgi:tRNA A37 N6-isopentenylltransferase MiaA
METGLIIAGPTTTGKSEITAELAHVINGAIINSDNYYFYANEDFHVGLGLAQDEPSTGIPCYLFGGRALAEPKPDPSEFYDLVIAAADDAQALGRTPIVQGCSFTLNNKLIEANVANNVYIPIWSSKKYLLERCYQRVQQMLDEGLVEETRKIVEQGLDKSWIATEGIIYAPTVEYIKDREVDKERLIAAIVTGIANKAEEQEQKYRRLEGVIWIEHDNNVEEALGKIVGHLASLGAMTH